MTTQPPPPAPWEWIVSAVAAVLVLALAGFLIYGLVAPETCEDWSAELVPAIEDGSFADGTFEPSEACAEQMQRDLERLAD